MHRTPSIGWQQIKNELTKRWFLFALVGAYILAGGLFSVLIYHYHWDQSATRWAAKVFPLPAARVNGETIWLTTYYRRLSIVEHYLAKAGTNQGDNVAADAADRKQKTLDQLIDLALLRHEARKAGITVSKKEVEDSFHKITDANGGEENFRKVLADLYGLTPFQFEQEFIPERIYQEKLRDQLFTQIHVRHIVLRDENQAKDVIAKLKAGQDFADLAKNQSQDLSSREQGGDLGWIRRGQLTSKPLEDAIFGLKAGQISETPIKTDLGFHVVKVDERKDGPISDQSFTDWFQALKDKASIKRYISAAQPAASATGDQTKK